MLNKKKIISLLLVLTILCSVAVTGFSVNAKNAENPGKIICQATLEDDFNKKSRSLDLDFLF